MDSKVIGRNIKRIRKSENMTQAQLSEMINISRNYLSDIERGRKSPGFGTIVKIADALMVDINVITGDTTVAGKKENLSEISKRIAALPDKKYREIMSVIEKILDLVEN